MNTNDEKNDCNRHSNRRMTKRSTSNEVIDNRSKLLDALRFVAFASSGHDKEQFNYIKINNRYLTAADDTITMGMPVDNDLDICVHGMKFKAAVDQCNANYKFTQIDNVSISIRSEKFRALVPSIDTATITDSKADSKITQIDNKIKEAFDVCAYAVDPKEMRIFAQGARLQTNTVIATNGKQAFEYWHGFSLPVDVVIPKRAMLAVSKTKKSLAALGYSDSSVTFWFEDDSFIKTKLLDTTYPNVNALFDAHKGGAFAELPSDLFVGIDAIETFIVDDYIYLLDGYVATNRSLEMGANYAVNGLAGSYAFSHKLLETIRPYAKRVSFPSDPRKPIMFYGDSLRGLLCGKNF
jgi:hypothetical protein